MIILTNKYKSKISYRELENTKACDLMRSHKLSERGLQKEINKHFADSHQSEKKNELNKIYSGDKK